MLRRMDPTVRRMRPGVIGAVLMLASVTAAAGAPVLAPITASERADLVTLARLLRSQDRAHLYVPVSRLQLLLVMAELEHAVEPDRQRALRLAARGVAFNIASDLWPGWGDGPAPVPAQHIELGRSAARLNLELATALGDVPANPYWINGAWRLAVGEYAAAAALFARAAVAADSALQRDFQLTWQALTRVLADPAPAELARLREHINSLRDRDPEAGSRWSLAAQLERALAVFLPAAEAARAG